MRSGRNHIAADFQGHRAAGFSLIEVLVVLAIVLILMAILLPALSMVRQTGIRTGCQSNLHGIGTAVAAYTMDYNFDMPTYYADSAIIFDTFRIRTDEGDLVNLGLLLTYLGNPKLCYCPGQEDEQSPSIAYDGPENRWQDNGAGPGGSGKGKGGPPSGAGGRGPRAGVNASYTVRFRNPDDDHAAAWNIINHTNKVIYSDFIGVDHWPGRGRFVNQINSPHRGKGYNRLFGDSSVLWAGADPLHAQRPLNDVEPSAEQLYQYYLLLDVLH